MALRGRKQKEIDKKQFEKLCSLQCTLEEICGFFDCSEDTIERWCKREYKANFAEVFRSKREIGKLSLRRSQFKMAESNPTMAIWLGKQYLGQKDHKDIVVRQTIEQETIDEVEELINGANRDAEKNDTVVEE